jgi:hypothetical protein
VEWKSWKSPEQVQRTFIWTQDETVGVQSLHSTKASVLSLDTSEVGPFLLKSSQGEFWEQKRKVPLIPSPPGITQQYRISPRTGTGREARLWLTQLADTTINSQQEPEIEEGGRGWSPRAWWGGDSA